MIIINLIPFFHDFLDWLKSIVKVIKVNCNVSAFLRISGFADCLVLFLLFSFFFFNRLLSV